MKNIDIVLWTKCIIALVVTVVSAFMAMNNGDGVEIFKMLSGAVVMYLFGLVTGKKQEDETKEDDK